LRVCCEPFFDYCVLLGISLGAVRPLVMAWKMAVNSVMLLLAVAFADGTPEFNVGTK
jgi:hypothetical protein